MVALPLVGDGRLKFNDRRGQSPEANKAFWMVRLMTLRFFTLLFSVAQESCSLKDHARDHDGVRQEPHSLILLLGVLVKG